ncbi:MAG: type I phosphomannose isomerase catalytic subunit, partial [Thermoanaerobaculia bacterium]|nr:type I phosphomannose isomerase catalytic subunit [Thermoanaerobaculia bacterium]
MKRIQRLGCVVRDYDWGSRTFLSSLRGEPPAARPEAELWIGAHPGGESTLADGGGQRLSAAIAAAPEAWLGPAGAAQWGGELPFLLKILAIEKPL